MDEQMFRQGIVNTEAIAAELKAADDRRTNADKWVLEIGMWTGFLLFLVLLWGVVAGFTGLW